MEVQKILNHEVTRSLSQSLSRMSLYCLNSVPLFLLCAAQCLKTVLLRFTWIKFVIKLIRIGFYFRE
jgi:hypothetical protein